MMVNILQRYYAGDASLLGEVEANAQSAGPIQQMARASLAIQVEDESAVVRKRRLEDLDIERIEFDLQERRAALVIRNREAEARHKDTELELASKITARYETLCASKTLDERASMIFKDHMLNMMITQGVEVAAVGPKLITDGRPISLSQLVAEKKLKIPTNELISIGCEVKKRYVAKYGQDPSKHDQLCGGRMTKVNSYTERDRPLLEDVLAWHLAGRLA